MKIPIVVIIVLLGISHHLSAQNTLEYYIDAATKNSPLLNKSNNDQKIVALDLQQIKSVLAKPEIGIDAGVLFAPIIAHDNNTNQFQWVSNGANDYSGYDQAWSNGGQYIGTISLKQPLFTGNSLRRYEAKADVLSQQNENNIALTVHDIEQLVTYQYILCLKSRLQITNNQELLDELSKRLQIMQKLVESALYKQTDLLLIQIEYQNYQLDSKTYEAEYQTSLYDLNLLCGINDTTLVDIEDIDLQLHGEIPAQSQFLNSFRLDSLNIAADRSVFGIKYLPKVSLFADAGLNAVYMPSFNRLGFSTGLTFSWNIYDGHQQQMVHDKSIINMATVEFSKARFITEQDINRNKILSQIKSLEQRINISEEQVKQYDQLLNVYQKELTQGEISVIDFRNIVRDRVAKKQQSIMLQMEKQLLINSYNYWNY